MRLFCVNAQLVSCLLVSVFLPETTAVAQTLNDIRQCRTIQNDIARLECFDGLASTLLAEPETQVDASDSGCLKTSLEDLKLDIEELRGHCVRVAGRLGSFGGIAMLRSDMLDSDPILVDYENLSREERREILRCQTDCPALVEGEVGEVMFQLGIRASSLIVN